MSQFSSLKSRHSEPLVPFSGRMLLGICFESGHSIWLYDFEATPTVVGAYREVWVVEPDDTRILYYDTDGATDGIDAYHEWDRSVLSDMDWEWTPDSIDITVTGSDGTTVELTGEIEDSLPSRLLTLMQRYLPSPLHRRLFGRHTETGKFGHLQAPQVRVVTHATARINGTSLGSVQPPAEPVTFGDVSAFDHPYVFVGDLLLEYSRSESDAPDDPN